MAGSCCFQAGGGVGCSSSSSSRTTTTTRRRPSLTQQPPWRRLVLVFLVLLLLVPSCCQATRGMQPFRGKPLEAGSANHFLGFLPRGPVPPSGPSRQHNSIGAQDQSHP
ncbi:hypothetical protein BDA96_04G182200 [Sorghum bicolor]|uniref:Uncharacterized protein n=2 Tax=Sorghum bicolor TaxID=4558 RepID=A0A921UIE2_SORBI|nr:protein IDA-LIKE 2 [Sorghum bicolor]KAG0533308.1 hypothetical protein BDA96_04G182200 [Sorghum bicolor]KXG30353.1 hypothetical protein SORBI_3004G169700 [Sorghum bicolor]|eukprot:XP_021315757.1 protein IDA-LIKE 2 [Sorghum bicolor]